MASYKVKLIAAMALALITARQAPAYNRIISLYSGHTDNIIALGGESHLIAVSKNDEPSRLENLPHIAPKSSAEVFIALKPDLVIMRTFNAKQNPELAGILNRAGIEVKLIDPPPWDNFEKYLYDLAPLIDEDPSAAAKQFSTVCDSLKSEVEKRKSGAAPKVFVEATAKELHTCAPDSWAAHLIALCGGENAAESAVPNRKGSAIAPWGLERTIATAADGLDVYIVQQGPMNRSTINDITSRSWYSILKNVNIVQMPEYELSRPSLLGLKNGGKKLIDVFYP